MPHWDIWTHGTSVQVEIPQLLDSIRRYGNGTDVKQKPMTDGKPSGNWFHFAIPTPTQIGGDGSVDHLDCWLKAELNTSARITMVHVWDGDDPVTKQNVDLRGPNVDYYLNLPDKKINLGLGISVHVEFEEGPKVGRVKFIGAAARFRD